MVLGLTNNMCRPRRIYRPHVRGKWQGSLPVLQYPYHWTQAPVDHNSKSVINLPTSFRYHGNLKAGFEQAAVDAADLALLLPKKGRSRKCRITKLPMEILLQIAEYVAPFGSSYHAFPSTRERWGGARKTILHAFSAEAINEEDRVKVGRMSQPRQHLTAMARACRVLSEAYYEVMYGSNFFIIEISATDVFPMIDGPTSTRVESWTKLAHGKLRQPMWPLTNQSIRYVKHLTILGTMHWDEKHAVTTQGNFYKAVHMLDQARRLSSLTIDLRRIPEPVPYVPLAPPTYPSSAATPNLNARLGWGVQGQEDTALRLRSAIFDSDECSGLAESWDIFNGLRGVREVILSGHTTKELADGLRARMMSQAAPANPGDGLGKAKKSSLKRKAAVSTWTPVKSIKRPLYA